MNTNHGESTESGLRNFSELLDNTVSGKLVFTNGAAMVRIFADINRKDLYNAYFEGLIPEIKTASGTVSVEYGYNFQFQNVHSPRGKILLNGFIPWDIVIHGWAYEVTFNLKELRLNQLDIRAAIKDMEIILPQPEYNIPVYVSGGASSLSISRPAGSEVQLKLNGGAKDLLFDEEKIEKVSGIFERETPGFKQASNRYTIHISSGATNLKLDRY